MDLDSSPHCTESLRILPTTPAFLSLVRQAARTHLPHCPGGCGLVKRRGSRNGNEGVSGNYTYRILQGTPNHELKSQEECSCILRDYQTAFFKLGPPRSRDYDICL